MMNILIIGLGSIAKKHIQAVRSLEVQVCIYALRSKPGSERYEDVINIFDLDNLPQAVEFAIISAPSNLHGMFISQLTQKGIPLFIEKPPLSTLMEADLIQNLIAQFSLKTYVACNLRFHPCIKYLKEFFTENSAKRVNEVNVYCGSYLPNWRPGQDYKRIYSANAESGGGVHLDLFHELDYTVWIFGAPFKSSSIKRNRSSLNINAIDYANYTLEYNDFAANIILNYYRKDAKRTLEIVFETETWTVDLLKNEIRNNQDTLIFEAENFVITDTYKNQMEYFLEMLSGNRLPMNTFAESLKTLKICLNE